MPVPLEPISSTSATTEELAFFDRVKKYLGNKNSMNEFLKLCNLFSQDLIDSSMLVDKSRNYIGQNQELMSWWENFLGYNDKDRTIENAPRPPPGRVALSNCRGLGPSYRLLPKRDTQAKCSGRDELCHLVLNDEWASHPTWASEDSGFVAHRKNLHEEGLHRIEEERHDYDFHIESCARTIQLLEPIAQQLQAMSPPERERYILHLGLGGQSETIYRRVIKKIYGRKDGQAVIDSLFRQPYSVVPALLNRLKSVLEIWKAAQREWMKVWREQQQKIFWRSLDHQSIAAKQADKRQFQLKTLQNEIHVKYEEQKRQREVQHLTSTQYQFAYNFEDAEVLLDAAQLVLIYSSVHHQTDHPKLMEFLKGFVSFFFGLDAAYVDQRVHSTISGSPSAEQMEEEGLGSDDGLSPRGPRGNARKPNLHRAVLERGRTGRPARDNADSVASESRGSTPDVSSTQDEPAGAAGTTIESPAQDAASFLADQDRWLNHPMDENVYNGRELAPSEPYKRNVYHMYCNLPIYCFFRLLVIFYERLLKLKQSESDVAEAVRRAQAPKPAIDLNMMDKQPGDFFLNTSDGANYYQQVLAMFADNVREGKTEVHQIEEVLRRYYLDNGWQLYTFDKLLSALTRFAIGVFSGDAKDKTPEIYALFKKDRVRETTSHEDEMAYRRKVEHYNKDTELYRISFVSESDHCRLLIY